MSGVRFEIKRYQVTLGADLMKQNKQFPARILGIIGCYGEDCQIMLNFIDNDCDYVLDSEEHNQSFYFEISPKYDPIRKVGSLFLPISMMPIYVDLLRNEKPLYGFVSEENPEWINVSTSHEAIGEND